MDDIQKAITFLEKLGINPLIVFVLAFITFALKTFDNRNKFKNGYVLIPLASSLLLFAFYMRPFDYIKYIIYSCAHAGLAAYGYDLYSTYRKNKKKKE